jgi:hypothetical protein
MEEGKKPQALKPSAIKNGGPKSAVARLTNGWLWVTPPQPAPAVYMRQPAPESANALAAMPMTLFSLLDTSRR